MENFCPFDELVFVNSLFEWCQKYPELQCYILK